MDACQPLCLAPDSGLCPLVAWQSPRSLASCTPATELPLTSISNLHSPLHPLSQASRRL